MSAFGILGACGFKEPFLFTLCGASLILCKSFKIWVKIFALPLLIAVITGAIILLCMGLLGDFYQYFQFMKGSHINRFGSPFRRAMNFMRTWDDLNGFAWGLAHSLLFLFFAPLAGRHKDDNSGTTTFIRYFAALLLSLFAVGCGGEFFNHHFVFALPLYLALFLSFIKEWNAETKPFKLSFLIVILLAAATLNLPNMDYEGRIKNLNSYAKNSKNTALYLDKVMDKMNIARYTFLGSNGPQVFGWTKHSPDGPYFCQYGHWFNDIDGFSASVLQSMKNAQIIVVRTMWKEIEYEAKYILSDKFTPEPWAEIADIEKPKGDVKIYFKKR